MIYDANEIPSGNWMEGFKEPSSKSSRMRMETEQRLPHGTLDRLALFAEWTGTKAPAKVLHDDGCPTTALLKYCRENGLNLDWLFMADEKGLVMAAHRAAKEARA